jgi:hypothetical protein
MVCYSWLRPLVGFPALLLALVVPALIAGLVATGASIVSVSSGGCRGRVASGTVGRVERARSWGFIIVIVVVVGVVISIGSPRVFLLGLLRFLGFLLVVLIVIGPWLGARRRVPLSAPSVVIVLVP